MYNNNLNSFYGIVKTLAKNPRKELGIFSREYYVESDSWGWKKETDSGCEGDYCMVGPIDGSEDRVFFPDFVALCGHWYERQDINLNRKLSWSPYHWLTTEAKDLKKVMDLLLLAVLNGRMSAMQSEELLAELLSVGRVEIARHVLATEFLLWEIPFAGDWITVFNNFTEGCTLSKEETIIDAGVDGKVSSFNPSSKFYDGLEETPVAGGKAVYVRNNGSDRPEVVFLMSEDINHLYYGIEEFHNMLEMLATLEKNDVVIEPPKKKTITSDISGEMVTYPVIELPHWAATRRA